MNTTPSEWEHLRADFEADAKALGFDVERQHNTCTVEPWDEYAELHTGERWGGFIAGYNLAKQAPLTAGDERRHVICLCPDCARKMPFDIPNVRAAGIMLPPVDISAIGLGPSIETNEE